MNYPFSLSFDDTINQSISCPYNSNYTTDIQDSFTILVLAKLNSRSNISNDFHALISNDLGVAFNNYYLLVNSDPQTLACFIANQGTVQSLTSTARFTNDQWNWFGMAYKTGVAQDVILNKTIKTQTPNLTVSMANNPLIVGAAANLARRINGNIARVWIMGGRITQSELNSVVDNGIKPPSLSQALMWDMLEGSGTSLNDSGPNSNTGTLNNGIVWDSSNIPSKTRIDTFSRTFADTRLFA